MRWRFRDVAESEIEAAARLRAESTMERFWKAFEHRAPDLERSFSGDADWDLPGFMQEFLAPIDPRLMWEFGPGIGGSRRRLVVTPEMHRHLRPMVDRFLELAPSLSGWSYLTHRPAEDLDALAPTVEARTGSPLRLESVTVKTGDHRRIDLSYSGDGPEELLNEQAFVATETLAGERLLDEWIGIIEVDPSGKGEPLETVRSGVERLADETRGTLPQRPRHALEESEEEWSAFELRPEEAAEYGGREDLFIGITSMPELFRTVHEGVPFSSERFTACGELFCYLKIDGRDLEPEAKLRDRTTIEELLKQNLVENGLGQVVGGGTGLAYSYVDLALTAAEPAFGLVREVLRDLGAPRSSWLLFFDDTLASEWVSIWDDSPMPPGLPG